MLLVDVVVCLEHDLVDFEPSENQWRAANGICGVRYLARRLVFVLDFDN